MTKNKSNYSKNWYLIFSAWIVATIATLGSLFFSEVMEYPPCVLCWYQRICMYPLTALMLIGLFPLDLKVIRFASPLVIVGLFISSYHNLLYYKILPESAKPCSKGISCTSTHIEWLGFVTIPFLSFVAFLLILLFLAATKKGKYNAE